MRGEILVSRMIAPQSLDNDFKPSLGLRPTSTSSREIGKPKSLIGPSNSLSYKLLLINVGSCSINFFTGCANLPYPLGPKDRKFGFKMTSNKELSPTSLIKMI